MDSVLRAAAVYLGLLVLFAALGKRSLAEVTIFDFVILLIISEAVSEALKGEDSSLTGAALAVLTLVALNRGFDVLTYRSRRFDKLLNDTPLVLVDDGRPIEDRMRDSEIDADDILERARELQGVERMDQVKYAVLERSGQISVIPR